MPYVTNRWLGGTLTNFQTMESRIDHLIRLEDRRDRGELGLLIKKEAGKLMEEIEKMNRYFGGIKSMKRLPAALFIVDPHGAHRRHGRDAHAHPDHRHVRYELQSGRNRLPDPVER